jgi:hypothetical protein
MKALRYLTVFLSLTIIMMLQACGGGSSASDTAGALTITAPSSTDNKDGSFTVSATVTYAPPAGKTAQGVVATTTSTDSFGNVSSDNHTFTSGSNSVTYSFRVFQSVGVSSTISIVSNIGDMKAAVFAVIPPITPISAPVVQFKSTDAAGTTVTSAITGGIAPYSIFSVSTTDLTVTLTGTTLNVTNNTPLVVPGVPTTGSIVITDAIGDLFSVTVGYFK